MAIDLKDYDPALMQGANITVTSTDMTIDDLTVNGSSTLGNASSDTTSIAGATTITSTSASSLAVGRLGATTPAFSVDSATASQAAGLKVTGATTTGTVAVETIGGAAVNLTVNAKGTGTIGIGSVSTGAVTIAPATTVTGVITPTGGVAAAGGFSVRARGIHTGGTSAMLAADGNDSTPVTTETYISEVFVPANCTVTGVAVFNGSDVTGNMNVGLANSAGAVVAESADTAGSGTDAYQLVPFTATYAAVGPATYYILVQYSSTTARYNTFAVGSHAVSKKTGETFGTFTTITPPTTFTTAIGNIASLY